MQNCWENYKKGKGVVVEIWDSKVQFGSLLKNKRYGYKSYVDDCDEKNLVHKAWVHGTGMASLIAADMGINGCSYRSIYPCNGVFIAGLAPESVVFNREIINACSKFSDTNRFSLMLEALDLEKDKKEDNVNKNNFGKQVIIDANYAKESKIIIINASIIENFEPYIGSLKQKLAKNENFPYLLIVAGVGNSHKELTEDILLNLKPAGLKVAGLSILRVGATNKYSSNIEVDLAEFSNYGVLVDILAPGAQIPSLSPGLPIPDNQTRLPANFEEHIGAGTSEATALVTGALTLMAVCNPRATAAELKQALLDNADKYDQLKTKVKDGRVLNVYKAVKNYCGGSDEDDDQKVHDEL